MTLTSLLWLTEKDRSQAGNRMTLSGRARKCKQKYQGSSIRSLYNPRSDPKELYSKNGQKGGMPVQPIDGKMGSVTKENDCDLLPTPFSITPESVLKPADDIHAFMQDANNQDSLLVVRIEDHMAFVEKAAVALSYVVHGATHFRIVAEQFKAVGEGLKIGFGSLDTEVKHGAGQDSLDITGSCF